MALNTSPSTASAGTTLAAAFWNAEVRDAFIGIQAAWTGYTPVVTSTGTVPTVGAGSIAGRYTRFGKNVSFLVQMAFGAGLTVGTGTYSWSLPPVASLQGAHVVIAGNGNFFDTSATSDLAAWTPVLGSTTTVTLRNAAGTGVGAASPVVPAAGDIITICGIYEAA